MVKPERLHPSSTSPSYSHSDGSVIPLAISIQYFFTCSAGNASLFPAIHLLLTIQIPKLSHPEPAEGSHPSKQRPPSWFIKICLKDVKNSSQRDLLKKFLPCIAC